jgi:hypothetical protein
MWKKTLSTPEKSGKKTQLKKQVFSPHPIIYFSYSNHIKIKNQKNQIMSTFETNNQLPGIFTDTATINKRVQLFLDNKYPALLDVMEKKGKPGIETKSVWYSRTHVETWLKEMEKYNANGMRIILGEYENLDVKEGENYDPSGQLCLLMVLTREGSIPGALKNIIYEKETDYDIRAANTPKDRSIYNNDDEGEGKDRNFNLGACCPPICIIEGEDFPNVSLT